MSEYVKIFKVKEGDNDKNNKLMSFCIDYEKLLETYKVFWTRIEDLKNIKLNSLRIYDDRYIKTKIRTYGDNIYTNFRGLNVPEGDIECESFAVISIDLLLVYDKNYYLPVYFDNSAHRIVNKRVTDYLDKNLFED